MIDIVKLRGEIENILDDSVVPGVVIAAGRRDGEKFIEAFGHRSFLPEREKNSIDTIYDLASLTKVIGTTTAVIQLLNSGKINLEMRVGEFIEAFRFGEKNKITLKNILCHTAGLMDWYPFFQELRQKEKNMGKKLVGTYEGKKIIYGLLDETQLVDTALSTTKYSDIGFILLGKIIEQITCMPLDEYCDKNIFKPLGLNNTFFIDLEKKEKGFCKNIKSELIAPTENSDWRNCVVRGEVHDDNAYAMGGVAGHAGIFGTASDVYRFGEVILDSYLGVNNFLPQRIIREFSKRQLLDRDSSWGLGWDTPSRGFSTSGHCFSQESIGHTGYTGTSLWIDLKKEIIVVILSNRLHPDRKNRIFVKVRPMLHDIVMEFFGIRADSDDEKKIG